MLTHIIGAPMSRLKHRSVCSTKRLTIGLLVLCCLPPLCRGLDPHKSFSQYVQTTLNDHNGLPQDSVKSIGQTTDGYLWFGTEEGIARFDGLRTTVLNTLKIKTLKDNYINVLAASRDGSLWIGTRSGVIRYQDGQFRTVLTPNVPVNAIYEDRDGRIWVGSMDGLFSIQDGRVRRYTASDGPAASDIHAIAEDKDGTLWFGGGAGLTGYKGGHFTQYPLGREFAGPVWNLAPSRDGSLWIAAGKSLIRWTDKVHGQSPGGVQGKILEQYPLSRMAPQASIASLLEDRDGILWISLEHNGLCSLRQGRIAHYTAADGLPSDEGAQLFEDRDGHLWAGFLEGGAVELRDGLFSNFGVREGLSGNIVWSVLQARDGSIWVGTAGKGLNHISRDGSVRIYTTADGLPDDSIYALCEAADGTLWIGSERGELIHYDGHRFTHVSDPQAKTSRLAVIHQDAHGDLWLGYHEQNGLVRFHDGRFEYFAVPGLLNAMAFAPDGSIWVGTDHAGVSHVKDGIVTTYTTRDGLLSDFSQSVYVDREGVVWAGTSPGGLNRIQDGRITTYSVEQGLFDLTVGAIVEDSAGNLWMTCNKGIFRVSKEELTAYALGRVHAIHSIVYGVADGLRSAECNFAADPAVWKSSNGQLWFATVAGIASVDLVHAETPASNLQLLLERVLLNQNPVPFAQGSVKGRGGDDLEIQFTAPNFTVPERIHFRYRLQNFDRDWVDVGTRREAYYTKLPPGRYVFEVQAANDNGPWVSNGARLPLYFQPHFWQTVWFSTLCVLAVIGLSLAVFRLRVRYLVARTRALEERVNQRTRELREAVHLAETAQEALREQATKDSLTGLWNRRSVFELLDREIQRGRREDYPVSVLMADLDHFKQINDEYGHLAGDSVLQQVCRRLTLQARTYDCIGRYGGEELIIVLPRCALIDGMKRAEEFRQAIASDPVLVGEEVIAVSCSFGVAVAEGEATAELLIEKADAALYLAKRTGRNRVYAANDMASSRA